MKVRRLTVAVAAAAGITAGVCVAATGTAQALPSNGPCAYYGAALRYDRAGLDRAHRSGDQHLINYYREQYNDDYLQFYRNGCD